MATKSTSRSKAPGYKCASCGWTTVKWVGRCAECQEWGTVAEIGQVSARTQAVSVANPAPAIGDVDASTAEFRPTFVGELDRVLGGGLVPGAVILLAGEPGVGKSTLLLDVASRAAVSNNKVLYVTGEESAAQVKRRAERIGALADTLHLTAESDLATALGHVEALDPDVLIVDSVQTLSSSEVDGAAGGVTQVREVAASLISAAKKRDMTTIMVGHVTKDGSIAGPRLLEHLVDVVCQFDGERHSRLRLLRAIKNRYGPTDEVGCFDLTENGIEGLSDPSGLFVAGSIDQVPGTCVTVSVEGRRPLLAEIQALLAKNLSGQARRSVTGLDSSRMSMILAVLQARIGMDVSQMDSYLATVGGVKLTEPAVDLASAVAMASSYLDRPVSRRLVVFGEVGLAGEVRRVPDIARRLNEAERLGFTHAIVPKTTEALSGVPEGINYREVTTLADALTMLFPAADS
ncbi:DNA repair protein RadA [Zhihengliuella flava]|uniref:DNA repair protein RadA n=1 Tax=Zhihengliuella flava TaxID=1285193 RepID=A0A931GF54_9MICC|nr:DNA repair protein RadA [Zhihengliuella flava]MBG6084845.1 DNA repair protein RadA/Sms [Zhihengliuella flava]